MDVGAGAAGGAADARAPGQVAARCDGLPAALLRLLLARPVPGSADADGRASRPLSRLVVRARPARLRAGGGRPAARGDPHGGDGAAARAQRRLVGARARPRAVRVRVLRRRRDQAPGRHPPVPRPELVPQPPALAPGAPALRAGRVRTRGEDRARRVRARALLDRRQSARLHLAALAPGAGGPARRRALGAVHGHCARARQPHGAALPRRPRRHGPRRRRRLGDGKGAAGGSARARAQGSHRPDGRRARAARRGHPRVRPGRLPHEHREDRAAAAPHRGARRIARPARRLPRHAFRGVLPRR